MKITRIINGQEITIELTPKEMREAYYEIEKDYWREDIETWLKNKEKEVDDEFKHKMLNDLIDNYDSDISHWANIASAYYNIEYYND